MYIFIGLARIDIMLTSFTIHVLIKLRNQVTYTVENVIYLGIFRLTYIGTVLIFATYVPDSR